MLTYATIMRLKSIGLRTRCENDAFYIKGLSKARYFTVSGYLIMVIPQGFIIGLGGADFVSFDSGNPIDKLVRALKAGSKAQ